MEAIDFNRYLDIETLEMVLGIQICRKSQIQHALINEENYLIKIIQLPKIMDESKNIHFQMTDIQLFNSFILALIETIFKKLIFYLWKVRK
jgi:hypothetical protein